MLARIDHLVWAVPDLDTAVAAVIRDWGVRPAMGGAHAGYGTRNALLALSPDSYLEIIGPDPAQIGTLQNSPFPFADLANSRLVAWFIGTHDIAVAAESARARGLEGYRPFASSRIDAAGRKIHWTMALSAALPFDPVPPQIIDWGDTTHPAASAPGGCQLVEFEARHPGGERLAEVLRALGMPISVTNSAEPGLRATIATPYGLQQL